jgi:alkylation response protein AidB-like acyl-CoA dehydrogenase
MHFALTEEQEQLAGVARSFLADVPGVREPDEGTWARIVEEQGWPAIVVPEEFGGRGFGLLELEVVFEELGRRLVPSPMLASALATDAVIRGGSEAQKARWLEALAEGTTGTLAFEGDVTAERAPGGWRLRGTARRVLDGHTAELVLVATPSGIFVVDDHVATALAVLDASRPLADVAIDTTVSDEARLPDGDLATTLLVGAVLLAAESCGAAEACMDESVEYAKVRTQFGKPIGTFQAVQHMIADMLVDVESARSAYWYAAWALQSGADGAAQMARTAKAMACDGLFRCAGTNIQVHGGIGFTWEHDAHFFFKRARASRSLLGEPAAHRAAIADELFA